MARVGYGRHTTIVATPDDGTSDVGTTEWNDDHSSVGMLGFTPTTKTIAAGGQITPTDSITVVAAASGTADDLDLITYLETSADDIMFLYADTGDTITVRHNQTAGAGEGNFQTTSAGSITLSETVPFVVVRRGTTFYQVIENTIATGDALVANPLSQFAATTSLQLKNTISDETGSGALVFGTSPTLVTPILGVAAATTVNKVALTTPATNATLTIVEGATLTASATATVSGTNTGDEVAASATVSGVAELATITEVNTGTDAIRTITPAGLAGSALQTKVDGIEALADVTDETNVAATASVIANTAKVTNATHTGDVTGATALTIGATKVTNTMLAGSIANTKLATDPLSYANMTAPVAAVAFNSQRLTGLADGVSAQDAATKNQVDVSQAGLDAKYACKVATTANVTLSGEQTIDGVLTSTDRILVKDQTAPSENGIYITAAGAWARSSDANTSVEVTSGMYTLITEGTASAGQGFVLVTADPITLDTTNLTFSQFSGVGDLVGGTGITKTGNTISVDASQTQITAIGTLTAGVLTGATGLPATTGLTATGTKDATTFLRGDDTWAVVTTYSAPTIGSTSIASGSTNTTIAGLTLTSPTLTTPILGTITSGDGSALTGTAASFTAGNVTTNANLTGHITSTGNASILGSFTKAQLDTAVSDASMAILGANTFTGAQDMGGFDVLGISNLVHDISVTTVALDFSADQLDTITVSATATFTCATYIAGASKTIKILDSGSGQTLAFPAGWIFVGTKPTAIAASKTGILTLTCFSTTEASVVAAYAEEA